MLRKTLKKAVANAQSALNTFKVIHIQILKMAPNKFLRNCNRYGTPC